MKFKVFFLFIVLTLSNCILFAQTEDSTKLKFGIGIEIINTPFSENSYGSNNNYSINKEVEYIKALNDLKVIHFTYQISEKYRIEPLFGFSINGGSGFTDAVYLIGTGLYMSNNYGNHFSSYYGLRLGVAPSASTNNEPELHPFAGIVSGGEIIIYDHLCIGLEVSFEYQEISESSHFGITSGRIILKFYP